MYRPESTNSSACRYVSTAATGARHGRSSLPRRSRTMAPAAPANGAYNLTLATPAFYLLVVTLALFVVMLLLLRRSTPGKRAFEGYLDAAGVSLGFLVFAVA